MDRARAGIDHVLLEATSDGHCALPLGKLKPAAVKLLDVKEHALSQMLASGSLLLEEIDGEPLVFLSYLRKAEEGIAAKVVQGRYEEFPDIPEYSNQRQVAQSLLEKKRFLWWQTGFAAAQTRGRYDRDITILY